MKRSGQGSVLRHALAGALALTAVVLGPVLAKADEGGVSLWVPGFFGSLAAAPLQPGWSLTTITTRLYQRVVTLPLRAR